MSVAPREGRRRILHLASGLLGGAALLLPELTVTLLLLGILAVALVAEAARHDSPTMGRVLKRLAGGAFRPEEGRGLSGPTYLATGYAAAWLLFPGHAAATAMMVTACADPAAAWIGSRVRPSGSGKTMAGTAAALLAALAVLLAARIAPLAAAAGAAAAAAAERLPLRGADNVAVPVVTAGVLWWLS